MNKFKEKQQLEYFVGNQMANDTKLNRMDEVYPSCQESCFEQTQKTNYILRKVTQRSKNLKWFFWRLEHKGWNNVLFVYRQLLLKQAHNAEMILQ